MSGFIPHLSRSVFLWAALACLAGLSLFELKAAPIPLESPQKFTSRFFKTHQQLNIRGVPNAELRRRLSVYLSLELLDLFATADRQRMDFPETDSKGNLLKPPWCEGDYFASRSEEGIDIFSVGKARTDRKKVIVPVRVTEGAITWTEELILLPTKSGWVIVDIFSSSEAIVRNEDGTTRTIKWEEPPTSLCKRLRDGIAYQEQLRPYKY